MRVIQKIRNMYNSFMAYPAASGILLCCAALLSLIVVNSPLNEAYDTLLGKYMGFRIDNFKIDKPILLWINDGLMAIFFLLVGCEVKREVLSGHLSSKERFMLPAFAALGGLLTPALIYYMFNMGNATTLDGWAIPAATDIAFAYGVLLLLGDKIPTPLKATLVAIAVIDDIAAIIIIALFYTSDLSYVSLVIASICVAILVLFNVMGLRKIGPYMIIGFILWASVLKSGVHATLAGVILGLCIPHRNKEEDQQAKAIGGEDTPLLKIEHALHSWVSFGVLPIFAFANAGVSVEGLGLSTFNNTITLGILFGLLLGKPIGVMTFTFIATQIKLCALPDHVNWKQYFGMALLTGIGFTMSFFVGTLAFDGIEELRSVRLGVLTASAISAVIGYITLQKVCGKNTKSPEQSNAT